MHLHITGALFFSYYCLANLVSWDSVGCILYVLWMGCLQRTGVCVCVTSRALLVLGDKTC